MEITFSSSYSDCWEIHFLVCLDEYLTIVCNSSDIIDRTHSFSGDYGITYFIHGSYLIHTLLTPIVQNSFCTISKKCTNPFNFIRPFPDCWKRRNGVFSNPFQLSMIFCGWQSTYNKFTFNSCIEKTIELN